MSSATQPYANCDQLPTLDAERLCLRWLREDDVPALFEVFSDPEVMRYWSSPPQQSIAEAAELLSEIQQLFADRQLFQWGIARVDDDMVIGTCTLFQYRAQHRRAEIGFALGRAWQGQGLAGEAVRRLIRHAVEELGIERLEADVDPRNLPSLKLLEKVGFQREGLLRARYRVAGEIQDTVLLGWLKQEQA